MSTLTLTRTRIHRQADWGVAHAWPILIIWSLVCAGAHAGQHAWSWHFLVTGVHALFSAHPLQLYAQHPELQMGPLSFLVGAPFVLLLRGGVGEVAGILVLVAVGLLLIREMRLLATPPNRQRQWFFVALLIVPAWAEIAVHWVHIDDALALLSAIIALRLIRTGHPLGGALLLGVAVDFKPWAVGFAALLLVTPRRQWLPLGALWVAVVAIAWGPFLLGDPSTLAALRYAIPIDSASTLHLIGTPGHGTPSWDRYAQLIGGFLLASVAVWRGRWASVFLLVVVIRLLLDPATKNYYDAALVIGAGIADLAASTAAVPVLTLIAVALVYIPSYGLNGFPEERAIIRTVALLALAALAWRLRRLRDGSVAEEPYFPGVAGALGGVDGPMTPAPTEPVPAEGGGAGTE
ncbi:MAG: hypothetical protein JWP75_581 [Frondihabitans sp.]|nr:hypothetical protein [Frondihabitans sp.]